MVTAPRGASKNLDGMMIEVREVNTTRGWRTGENTFGDYIALLHSELSQALEAYRDYRLADVTDAETGKPEGVGSEFADVLIRLLDVCDVYGIDLTAEYQRKIAYNRTRPDHDGGLTEVQAAFLEALLMKRETQSEIPEVRDAR